MLHDLIVKNLIEFSSANHC